MLEVRPTRSALGADIIGVDLAKPLTSAEFGTSHAARMRHLGLRFREQRLTERDNRRAPYRRDESDGGAPRVMHRTRIAGDRPF